MVWRSVGWGERKLEHFLFRCGDFSIVCLAQRKTNPYFWDVDTCLEKEGAAWDKSKGYGQCGAHLALGFLY